jgi:transcriptional regulator with XRE-family HTH domain
LSQSQSQRSDFRNAGFFVYQEDMSLEIEINEVIENRRTALKMSKLKLAKSMGISAQYLGQLLDNNEEAHRWNVEKLGKAFEVLGIKATYKAGKVKQKGDQP